MVRRNLFTLLAANFLLAFHLFLIAYLTSAYLSTFIEERFVGTVYMVGSVASILAFFFAPEFLRLLRAPFLLLVLVILEFASYAGLALGESASVILPFFGLHLMTYPLVFYLMDLALESMTKDESGTGRARGLLLTVTNLGLLMAPFVGGLLADAFGYQQVFFVGALFLLPYFFFMQRGVRDIARPETSALHPLGVFRCIRKHPGLSSTFKAHFLLQMFFAWMVIYTPLYLFEYIGFDWKEIGLMLTIMLVPYLLIELPAGNFADRQHRGKELQVIGFVIVAASTAALSFITSSEFVLWAIILFLTRAGAALIEITTETYFFRNVDARDSETISYFRALRPLSYIVAPLLGTVFLIFFDFQYLFAAAALVMVLGIWYSGNLLPLTKAAPASPSA